MQSTTSALDAAGLRGLPYIPSDFQPSIFGPQIEFPSGASVQLGNHLNAADTKDEPTVSFIESEPSSEASLYTLVSFDPDAPSREDQSAGPWRHWVVPGLKPKALDALPTAAVGQRADEAVKGLSVTGLVDRTEEVMSPWVAASPGAGTGDHRYCFLLYKQSRPLLPLAEQVTFKGLRDEPGNERPHRRHFDAAKFAADNALELVAVNFFLCRNDAPAA